MGSEIVVFEGDGPIDRPAFPPIIAAAREAAAARRSVQTLTSGFNVTEILPKVSVGPLGSTWETTIASFRETERLLPSLKVDSILGAGSRIGDVIAKVNLIAERYAFKTPQLVSLNTRISDMMRTVDMVASIVPPNLGVFSNSLLDAAAFHLDRLLPLIQSWRGIDWASFTQPLRTPANWPDDVSGKLDALLAMVNDEGIPVAWVPRVEVLDTLLAASPGDERSEVLIAHRDQILEDCEDSLADMDDPFLDGVLPIAREVLEVYRDGHWRVAAIAAVPVIHAVVEGLEWVSDRQRVAKYHRLEKETPYVRMLEQATRAPLVRFYDDWNPKSGQPRPAHLTRHVVSHHLGADQVSERNCIVAVMLMASLLNTVYQLELGSKHLAA